MYIEQSFRGSNSIKDYFIGLLLVFVVWSIFGSIPVAFTMNVFEVDTLEELLDVVGVTRYFILIMQSFVLAFLGLWFVIRKIHKCSISDFITSRPNVDFKRFYFSFIIWGSVIFFSVVFDYFDNKNNYTWVFDPSFFILQIGLSLFFITIQSAFEEFLFRGYLMKCFATFSKYRWVPLLVSSVLFGLLHGSNPEVEALGFGIFFFYISSGLLLGILVLMDGGLELAIGFHVANNLIASLLVSYEWSAIQSYSVLSLHGPPELGWVDWITVIVFYPILIFIFSKKYGWKDWKEKLFGKIEKEKE